MVYFSESDIDAFIGEDLPYYDLTAEALQVDSSVYAQMSFCARQKGVVACSEEAAMICARFGLSAKRVRESGSTIEAGDYMLVVEGRAKECLKAWKPAQNMLEYACGVATATKAMSDAVRSVNPSAHFATTRKTIPGTKKISIKAVLAGGGNIHRLGLSESVLIFSKYRDIFGYSMQEVVITAKQNAIEQKITVEVSTRKDALEAALAGADIIQCDKVAPSELAAIIKEIADINPFALVSATGGINIANVKEYAATGADLIVSSSVYFAKPFDVQVAIV